MKSEDAAIFWNRKTGKVFIEDYENRAGVPIAIYPQSGGACNTYWRTKATHGKLILETYAILTGREGVDPQFAFNEFMKIDEFEEAMVRGMP